MKNINYLFDVDVLIPMESSIDRSFFHWFSKWSEDKTFHLVSDRNYDYLQTYVGKHLLERARTVFASSGNSVYIQGKQIMNHHIELPVDLLEYFDAAISSYPLGEAGEIRCEPYLDYRRGLVGFSAWGYGTSPSKQPDMDVLTEKYMTMVDEINARWPKLEATLGGGHDLVITEKGRGKEQIINMIQPPADVMGIETPVIFYTGPIAEKYSACKLAAGLLESFNLVYSMKDWRETWQDMSDAIRQVK